MRFVVPFHCNSPLPGGLTTGEPQFTELSRPAGGISGSDNMQNHGELALIAAIESGTPVATNAAQAAELERLNGAKHAAKVAEKITVTGTGPFMVNFPGEDPMEAGSLDAVTLEMLLNFARSLGRVQVRMEHLADAERRAFAVIGGAL